MFDFGGLSMTQDHPPLPLELHVSSIAEMVAAPGLVALEVCAGAGGQAVGIERAGFQHAALVEIDPHACATLRHNRPEWKVLEQDLKLLDGRSFKGIDLLAGGVPCPPFSIAGRRLGAADDRDLFPEVLRLARQAAPRAVMVENVRGLLAPRFGPYRAEMEARLRELGFQFAEWRLFNACDFGVPQLRPRAVLVALRAEAAERFRWPDPTPGLAPTVGEALYDEMSKLGWDGAAAWRQRASRVAPTLVGGSRLHGGPDLGPTRARQAWAELGVDGGTIAEHPPLKGHVGLPRLTIRMAATIQGFPDEWEFVGRKTHAYRQVGNAFPPPVAEAVARRIAAALTGPRSKLKRDDVARTRSRS